MHYCVNCGESMDYIDIEKYIDATVTFYECPCCKRVAEITEYK